MLSVYAAILVFHKCKHFKEIRQLLDFPSTIHMDCNPRVGGWDFTDKKSFNDYRERELFMVVKLHTGNWKPATVDPPLVSDSQKREAVHMALEMSRQVSDWETFFREVVGVDGLLSRLFPSRAERAAFEQTPEYVEIQHIMARLRGKRGRRIPTERETTRVITVRLPESLHASLMAEASTVGTSMNKLCISKLLQIVEDDLMP
jgi:predicted HicB family RNase H-like nuclease